MATPNPPSPENAFVLAMREMWNALVEYRSFGYPITHQKWMEAACFAFADAVCGAAEYATCYANTPSPDVDDPEEWSEVFNAALTIEHAKCRTRILARVMEGR